MIVTGMEGFVKEKISRKKQEMRFWNARKIAEIACRNTSLRCFLHEQVDVRRLDGYNYLKTWRQEANYMTLGEKIQKLRKQSGLSQEALAEKVMVTRQTISKWELGQSLPDLDFVARLSDIFHVSSDYLIKDEWNVPDELPYKKRNYRLTEKSRRMILVIVSASALIAIYICLICDYFTAEKLSWSLIASVSVTAAWFVLLPLLTAKTKIILKTIVISSVIPIPLLAVLSLLLKKTILFKLGSCITLIALVAIWIIYIIFHKCKRRWYRASGFALSVLVPVPIAINHTVSYFLPQAQIDFTSDIFNSGITLLLSLVFWGLDYFFSHREGNAKR